MYKQIGIDLSGKKITIVGGGEVALRRVKSLACYSCEILVLAPEIDQRISDVKASETLPAKLKTVLNCYDKKYIEGSFLVIAATNQSDINRRVYEDCRELNILVNMPGGEEKSDIIFPAEVFAGSLSIAVSTNGKFPLLSRYIRKDLQERYTRFSDEYIEILEELRHIVLADYREDRHKIFAEALQLNLAELKNYKNLLKRPTEER